MLRVSLRKISVLVVLMAFAAVSLAEGIQFVLVKGVAVVKEGRFVDGILPGRAARAPIS